MKLFSYNILLLAFKILLISIIPKKHFLEKIYVIKNVNLSSLMIINISSTVNNRKILNIFRNKDTYN